MYLARKGEEMRKLIAIVAGATLLTGAAAPKTTFEYKGFRAGDAVDAGRLADCAPKAGSVPGQMAQLLESWAKENGVSSPDPDVVSCSNPDARLAGVKVLFESIVLYRARLSSVTVMFDAVAFDAITRALQEKYGTPCRTEIEKLQNLFGANVTGSKITWCFASGELTANMYYPDLRTSTVEYLDKNKPLAGRPKVDF